MDRGGDSPSTDKDFDARVLGGGGVLMGEVPLYGDASLMVKRFWV